MSSNQAKRLEAGVAGPSTGTPWLPDVTQTGRNAAGDFTLSAFWSPGQTVRIEAATRLMNPDWTAIHATAIPPSGTLEFTDADAASHPARFYRIVGP